MTTKEIREKIRQRRAQLEFDNLPKDEQERRRKAGLDPYESEQIRAKKRAAEIERRKKFFNTLSKETRDQLTALGLSPYQDGEEVIRRECGTLSVKK